MDAFIQAITHLNVVTVFIRLFALVFGLLYLFYSGIFIRQVFAMAETLTFEDNSVLRILSYVQLGLAIFVLLASIFLL